MKRQVAREQVFGIDWFDELELTSARRLAELLKSESLKVVFAESCTLGGVSVALGSVPGISDYLCGSAIAYRDREKTDWLSVSEVGMRQWGSVCAPVASLMAFNVLKKTPEADYAVSITGCLGPNAPPDLDGVIYVGLAWRDGEEARLYRVEREKLTRTGRMSRLSEATDVTLKRLTDCILATHTTSHSYPESAGNGHYQPEAI